MRRGLPPARAAGRHLRRCLLRRRLLTLLILLRGARPLWHRLLRLHRRGGRHALRDRVQPARLVQPRQLLQPQRPRRHLCAAPHSARCSSHSDASPASARIAPRADVAPGPMLPGPMLRCPCTTRAVVPRHTRSGPPRGALRHRRAPAGRRRDLLAFLGGLGCDR